MAQCWNNRLLRLFRKIIYLRCSDYVLKKIFVVQKIINIFIKADILPNKSVNCFRLIRALNVKPIAVFVFWFIIHNHLPYKVYGLVGCSQWQLLSCAVSRRGVCPAAYPWRCAAVSKTLRSPWDSATDKSKIRPSLNRIVLLNVKVAARTLTWFPLRPVPAVCWRGSTAMPCISSRSLITCIELVNTGA